MSVPILPMGYISVIPLDLGLSVVLSRGHHQLKSAMPESIMIVMALQMATIRIALDECIQFLAFDISGRGLFKQV